MKTEKELEQIKTEYTELNKKLAELNDEELEQISGGVQSYRGETNIVASTADRIGFKWEISENS